MARILVVDDAAFMRKMVSDALTKGGHEVVGEAGNGAEAIERFQELKPELTTLDITMPEKDGLAALKEIIEIDPTARVIMCSALGQESKVLESIKLVEERVGESLDYEYVEENREGDHICYISDLRLLRADYPEWQLSTSLGSIIDEVVDAELSRQVAATS